MLRLEFRSFTVRWLAGVVLAKYPEILYSCSVGSGQDGGLLICCFGRDTLYPVVNVLSISWQNCRSKQRRTIYLSEYVEGL